MRGVPRQTVTGPPRKETTDTVSDGCNDRTSGYAAPGVRRVQVRQLKRGEIPIETLAMLEGDLPARAHRLVSEWAEQHRSELSEMWSRQEFRQLPGLE